MFKVLQKGCEPTRGSKYSACVDLYASEDVVIGGGETKLVGLGVAIDGVGLKKVSDRTLENLFGQTIDYIIGTVDGDEDLVHFDSFKKSHYLQLMLRSSLGKKGLILPNGVGIIDLDYAEELKMIIHNPIIHIEREVEFDKEDDYIKIDYMGVPCNDKYVCSNMYKIKKGDKIAQITLLEHKSYLFGINTDKEREGGFGSTGK